MKQFQVSTTVVDVTHPNNAYYIIRCKLPLDVAEKWHTKAGNFAQLLAPTPGVLLRRPISIAAYDDKEHIISFLIQEVGKASSYWKNLKENDELDIIAPLGNAFNQEPDYVRQAPLLVAGGVGIAPIRMLAQELAQKGIIPTILYGARSADLFVYENELRQYGKLLFTTEDGSKGEKGYVSDHPAWHDNYSAIYACGPDAMMMNVAKMAQKRNIPCQISLEHKMACGIGACLCCVVKTTDGNLCTCTEGPVFNTQNLILS